MKLLSKLLAGSSTHPPVIPAPDPQCVKTTTRGTRCKLPKAPGKETCAMHGAKP